MRMPPSAPGAPGSARGVRSRVLNTEERGTVVNGSRGS